MKSDRSVGNDSKLNQLIKTVLNQHLLFHFKSQST